LSSGFQFFVGIDWATERHQILVMKPNGEAMEELSVEHTGAGLTRLAERLNVLSEDRTELVAVAIEVPRGAVVESLVERGFAVFAINPKQLDRFRDRYCVSGAKDDRRDAFVLADSLRTDERCFRRVALDDPLIIQIREFSRLDEDLIQELVRLGNRLRDQLRSFYPQVFALSPAADEPWLWSLLELAPTPADVKRLRRPRIEKLLREYRIRRLTTDDVLAALKVTPLSVAPGVVEARTVHVSLLLPRLRLLLSQRKDCQVRLENLLADLAARSDDEGNREHHDVEILRSLPGVGRVVAATMLAEASQPIARRDYLALRAIAGVAPVTRQSGKGCLVVMRRACNSRLRTAVYHWARVSTQHDPLSRARYDALRQRGHRHGRALRGVADRLLRVLISMLTHRTLYEPNRVQQLAQTEVPTNAVPA
jgi:transposase